MLTKPSAELTLFDILSRLTFTRAAKLLGPQGDRLIATGGKFDIDLTTQVKFDRDMFRLTLDGAAVTLTLSPAARHRLEWRCDACELPCEHAGAAFSLILEEKLALVECLESDEQGRPRLTVTLPNEAALESLARSLAALFSVTET